ncbi:unnamed protein product [Medioppia subpectinata]|uniref:Uncharacterized protein n=1 Tax=Medioppia subpectinata TaxID=1979941 RepID=A0A7R9LJG7_9ACAR|nr:unnamed protein product [Medioppia subpectinata]CAG2119302.1 unnamed protein product [Medioppia subpectinata]
MILLPPPLTQLNHHQDHLDQLVQLNQPDRPKKSVLNTTFANFYLWFPASTGVTITPIVSPNVTYSMEAPCVKGSVIDHLSYEATFPSPVTCTGVIVSKQDDEYNATFAADSTTEMLKLTKLTQIFAYVNGNQAFPVCGKVTGGRCDGDTFWGNGVLIANTQTGCQSPSGVSSVKVLFSDIEVIGKCSSRCNSAGSVFTYNPPVNAKGFVNG